MTVVVMQHLTKKREAQKHSTFKFEPKGSEVKMIIRDQQMIIIVNHHLPKKLFM